MMSKKIISIVITIMFSLTLIPLSTLATSTPSLYLGITEVSPLLSVGNTFTLPIKAEDSASSSRIFSYNLLVNFDKEYIKAIDIKGGTTDGLTGPQIYDNTNGVINFWFSTNISSLTDKIATVTFEVIKAGEAFVTIDKNSSFYKNADSNSDVVPVNYSDSDDYDSNIKIKVGTNTVAKPLFLNTSKIITTSSLTVKFKERTDGAKIYYTTSSRIDTPTENNEEYDEEEGIRISNTSTIKAVAIKDGISSGVLSGTFTRQNIKTGGSGGGGGGGSVVITNPVVPVTPPTVTTEQTERYNDIKGHWSKTYFETLINKGIINGYEDGTVRPDNSITRAEAAKIIIAAVGLNPSTSSSLSFDDTATIDGWAMGYIQTAVEKGIITGYEDNTFRPTQNVSRKELVVLAIRAFKLTGGNMDDLTFTDKNIIPSWAEQSIATALKLGILAGYEDNTFKPDNNVTRGESTKIISTCMGLKN